MNERVIKRLRENVKMIVIYSFVLFIVSIFIAGYHDSKGDEINTCISFAVSASFGAIILLSIAIYKALEEVDSDG